MDNESQTPNYVCFDKDLCSGSRACLKGCPTLAIRIRQNKSCRLEGLCIGCGQCVRACPSGAVRAASSGLGALEEDQISVAMVSPILYAQFPGFMPKDVLLGLRRMGFHHTVDMSYFLEMFQYAAEEYIRRNRVSQESPWPLISPVCPVVVRLIAHRFPNLMSHVIPIMRPISLMAREVRDRIVAEYEASGKQVSLYYINPCPTKKESCSDIALGESRALERAIGINEIYAELSRQLEHAMSEDRPCFYQPRYEFEACATGNGPMWGMSGGEVADMNIEHTLAVSGLSETINYLEKIELGLFRDVEYMEFRVCPEGCLGGALTAIDKYLAKNAVQKMVKRLGLGKRLSPSYLRRLYDKGWFLPSTSPSKVLQLYTEKKKPLTLDQLKEIERLVRDIDGRDCAMCGAPDCRTFAEDVVRGKVSLEECLLVRARDKDPYTAK